MTKHANVSWYDCCYLRHACLRSSCNVKQLVQVATPRVRTAVKAEIPHIDDHVSKLQAVGIMTQNKLQDITAAAAAVGVFGITVPYNCVTKGAPPLPCPDAALCAGAHAL